MPFENCESVGDRNFQTLNPEILCQRQRIENAAARRKLAGDGNAGDIVGAQRIHSKRRDDSGINSTAQSEHGTFETALCQIIAQTQAQGEVKFLNNISRRDLRSLDTLGIDDYAGLLESWELGE